MYGICVNVVWNIFFDLEPRAPATDSSSVENELRGGSVRQVRKIENKTIQYCLADLSYRLSFCLLKISGR
jgi:hypothetical protein